jgi:nucleoside-diphosphate-sugar epimerase
MVTGGSGFVGSAVVGELQTRGYSVSAMLRTTRGGIFDPVGLDAATRGCDAVIHLVGIIKERPSAGVTFERIHYEGTVRVVDAAVRAGVKRFVHMSALGARPNAVSTYHRTKFAAEEYVRASGLDWTIFRPSLIHGARGEFMRMEARWARRTAPPFLFMPYFGGGLAGRRGAGRLQPVFVDDVARAFVDALGKPDTVGEVYPMGGPDQVTWPQLHRMCARAIIGHTRLVMAVPVWYAKLLTHVVPRALLPFNRDQVIMSQEDNVCDLEKFTDALGWTPRAMDQMLSDYAKQL